MTVLNTITVPVNEAVRVSLPAVLTIAGSDSSGGAGIEADLKTFTTHGVYGLTCITALTAQNTKGVDTIQFTSSEQIRNILKMNSEDFILGYENEHPLKVIKTGMLTSQALQVIPEFLPLFEEKNIKLVVDPVMITTSGTKLIDNSSMKLCLDSLIKSAYLLTPNFPEALALFRLAAVENVDLAIEIASVDDLVQFVIKLQQLLQCENILVKGGHIPFDRDFKVADSENSHLVIDVLYESKTQTATLFKSDFIVSNDTHGTGCTLASAISSNLAKGTSLIDSILNSIEYIHRAMQSATKLGHGNGPLNHNIKVLDNHSKQDNTKSILDKTYYEYFKSHPLVVDNWHVYSHHDFIKRLATNNLHFDQFLYYLKQDYYYLVNYAYVHEIAAKLAPTETLKQAQLKIVEEILGEINRHKQKLKGEYNIEYDTENLDKELQPGPACLAYCNYLLDISKSEDFTAIKVAVAPCLHGYKEAGDIGQAIRATFDKNNMGVLNDSAHADIYSDWLQDYSSDWYEQAHINGIESLQLILLEENHSSERLDRLTTIFNEVTKLEIAFWDEVLDIERND